MHCRPTKLSWLVAERITNIYTSNHGCHRLASITFTDLCTSNRKSRVQRILCLQLCPQTDNSVHEFLSLKPIFNLPELVVSSTSLSNLEWIQKVFLSFWLSYWVESWINTKGHPSALARCVGRRCTSLFNNQKMDLKIQRARPASFKGGTKIICDHLDSRDHPWQARASQLSKNWLTRTQNPVWCLLNPLPEFLATRHILNSDFKLRKVCSAWFLIS